MKTGLSIGCYRRAMRKSARRPRMLSRGARNRGHRSSPEVSQYVTHRLTDAHERSPARRESFLQTFCARERLPGSACGRPGVLLIRHAEVTPSPLTHQPHEETSRVRCADPQRAARGGEHPLPIVFAAAHETVSVRLCVQRFQPIGLTQVFHHHVTPRRGSRPNSRRASPSRTARRGFLVCESP